MSAPKLITQRALIRGIVATWEETYSHVIHHPEVAPADQNAWGKEIIALYEQLKSLNLETATVADVAAIIDESWISLECDGCDKRVTLVVQCGAELEDDSATCHLCADCLGAASALLDNHEWGL